MNVIKFQRKKKLRKPFRIHKTGLIIVFLSLFLFVPSILKFFDTPLVCDNPSITDGDTLKCNGVRIRLVGIDAPEMPGHCRAGRKCIQGDPYAAQGHLESITRTRVKCFSQGHDHYGRTLARCEADGIDLSCEMIKSGHAERRYSFILCM